MWCIFAMKTSKKSDRRCTNRPERYIVINKTIHRGGIVQNHNTGNRGFCISLIWELLSVERDHRLDSCEYLVGRFGSIQQTYPIC